MFLGCHTLNRLNEVISHEMEAVRVVALSTLCIIKIQGANMNHLYVIFYIRLLLYQRFKERL